MNLNIYPSIDELLHELAEYFVKAANQSIKENGRFSVSLSGGSSPEKLYALLASDAFRDKVDWTKMYFFVGDERYVPQTDDANNFKMISRVLFEPLKIKREQQFPVDTTLSPEASAAQYMQAIKGYFGEAEPRFDLILLGLGDNSHTASLFPFTDILQDDTVDIKAVFLPDQKVYRISFTAPLINMAHRIAFLVYGSPKAAAVHNVLRGEKDIENYPAQMIQPSDGTVDWFLDEAAAAKIRPVG